MAFIVIDPSRVDPGEPVKAEFGLDVINDLNDLDARLADLEAASGSVLPETFNVKGSYFRRAPADLVGSINFTARTNFEITAARLITYRDSVSGTLEVDLLHSDDGGSTFNSIFSTKPSLAHPALAYDISSNQILTSTPYAIAIGDHLRLDITSIQIYDNADFSLILDTQGVA